MNSSFCVDDDASSLCDDETGEGNAEDMGGPLSSSSVVLVLPGEGLGLRQGRPMGGNPGEGVSPFMVGNVPLYLDESGEGKPLYYRQLPQSFEIKGSPNYNSDDSSFGGFSDNSDSTFEGFGPEMFEGFIEDDTYDSDFDGFSDDSLEVMEFKQKIKGIRHSLKSTQYQDDTEDSLDDSNDAFTVVPPPTGRGTKVKSSGGEILKDISSESHTVSQSGKHNSDFDGFQKNSIEIKEGRQKIKQIKQWQKKAKFHDDLDSDESFGESSDDDDFVVQPSTSKGKKSSSTDKLLSKPQSSQPARVPQVAKRKNTSSLSDNDFQQPKRTKVDKISSEKAKAVSERRASMSDSPHSRKDKPENSARKGTPVPPKKGSDRTPVPPKKGSDRTPVPPKKGSDRTPVPPKKGSDLVYLVPVKNQVEVKQEQEESDTADEEFIGPYCSKVGCTISWLESMSVKQVAVTIGMVFELDEFAKRINWEKFHVAKWILRLRGILDREPTGDDMDRIYVVLKRRKALMITLSGKQKGHLRLQEFDDTLFSLPTEKRLKEEKYLSEMMGTPFCGKNEGEMDSSLDEKSSLGTVGMSMVGFRRRSATAGNAVQPLGIKDVDLKRRASADSALLETSDDTVNSSSERSISRVVKRHKKSLDTRVTFFSRDHHYYPHFNEVGISIGQYCSDAGLTVEDLNAKGKKEFFVSQGVVCELYSFYIERGCPITSLALKLMEFKGCPSSDLKNTKLKIKDTVKCHKAQTSKTFMEAEFVYPSPKRGYLGVWETPVEKANKLTALDPRVKFYCQDNRIYPHFNETDISIGRYCDLAGLTVNDLNAGGKKDIFITQGMVSELHGFYRERGCTVTSLAQKLLELKDQTSVNLVSMIAKLSLLLKRSPKNKEFMEAKFRYPQSKPDGKNLLKIKAQGWECKVKVSSKKKSSGVQSHGAESYLNESFKDGGKKVAQAEKKKDNSPNFSAVEEKAGNGNQRNVKEQKNGVEVTKHKGSKIVNTKPLARQARTVSADSNKVKIPEEGHSESADTKGQESTMTAIKGKKTNKNDKGKIEPSSKCLSKEADMPEGTPSKSKEACGHESKRKSNFDGIKSELKLQNTAKQETDVKLQNSEKAKSKEGQFSAQEDSNKVKSQDNSKGGELENVSKLSKGIGHESEPISKKVSKEGEIESQNISNDVEDKSQNPSKIVSGDVLGKDKAESPNVTKQAESQGKPHEGVVESPVSNEKADVSEEGDAESQGVSGEGKDESEEQDAESQEQDAEPQGVSKEGKDASEEAKADSQVVGNVESKNISSEREIESQDDSKKVVGDSQVVGNVESKSISSEREIKSQDDSKKVVGDSQVVGNVESKSISSEREIELQDDSKKVVGESQVVGNVESKSISSEREIKSQEDSKKVVGDSQVVGNVESKNISSEREIKSQEGSKKVVGDSQVVGNVESNNISSEREIKSQEDSKKVVGDSRGLAEENTEKGNKGEESEGHLDENLTAGSDTYHSDGDNDYSSGEDGGLAIDENDSDSASFKGENNEIGDRKGHETLPDGICEKEKVGIEKQAFYGTDETAKANTNTDSDIKGEEEKSRDVNQVRRSERERVLTERVAEFHKFSEYFAEKPRLYPKKLATSQSQKSGENAQENTENAPKTTGNTQKKIKNAQKSLENTQKNTECTQKSMTRSGSARSFLKRNDPRVSFTMVEGRIIPFFKEADYYLGEYCAAIGLTIDDLNSDNPKDITFTKGAILELVRFYQLLGCTMTSLADRLLKMKKLYLPSILNLVAKFSTLQKTVENPKKLNDVFLFPPGEYNADDKRIPNRRNPKTKNKELVPEYFCEVIINEGGKKKKKKGKKGESVPLKKKKKEKGDKKSRKKGKKKMDVPNSPGLAMKTSGDVCAVDKEVEQLRGKEGSVTRADIVLLYVQWLSNKNKTENTVFVTDLLRDVMNLMEERKVPSIRIPAGTLMSSSVKLYEEYKRMWNTNKTDAMMYLEDDWLEDIQYLVSLTVSSKRATAETSEGNDMEGHRVVTPCYPQGEENYFSDSSERSLRIDETYASDSSDGEGDGGGKKFKNQSKPKISSSLWKKEAQQKIGNSPQKSASPMKPSSQKLESPKKEFTQNNQELQSPVKDLPYNYQMMTDNQFAAAGPEKYYEIDKIVDYRCKISKRKKKYVSYLVRWKGLDPQHDTWIEESLLRCPQSFKNLWTGNTSADKTPDVCVLKEKSCVSSTSMVNGDKICDKENSPSNLSHSKCKGEKNYMTNGELLDLYDFWREENHEKLASKKPYSISVKSFADRFEKVMKGHGLKAIYSDVLLQACFYLTLIRKMLNSEEALQEFLGKDCLPALESSRINQQNNQKVLGTAKIGVLSANFMKVKTGIMEAKTKRLDNRIQLATVDDEVRVLERSIDRAQGNSGMLGEALQEEIEGLEKNLIKLSEDGNSQLSKVFLVEHPLEYEQTCEDLIDSGVPENNVESVMDSILKVVDRYSEGAPPDSLHE